MGTTICEQLLRFAQKRGRLQYCNSRGFGHFKQNKDIIYNDDKPLEHHNFWTNLGSTCKRSRRRARRVFDRHSDMYQVDDRCVTREAPKIGTADLTGRGQSDGSDLWSKAQADV